MATITGTTGNDVLQASNTGDTLNGLAGNDVLIGGTAADSLNGGEGVDTMIGGDGNDTYVVDNAGDVVNESIADDPAVAGVQGGVDLVQTSISYALGANVENLTATGTGNITLTGNTLANLITGNAGANVLDGGLDTFNVASIDTLNGGSGSDTYIVRDGAVEIAGEIADDAVNGTVGGSDTVIVIASQVRTAFTLTAGQVVENIIASDGSSTLGLDLTGNALAQTIVGNAGVNTLTGGGGADTLIGLDGNDIYNISTTNTVVREAANGGNDIVNIVAGAASGTYTIGDNIETINASAATGVTLSITGGAGNQTITGNNVANTLNGGAGNDTLIGGLGDDTYLVDSLGDVVTEAALEGTDRVIASSSYALAANSSVEYLAAAGTSFGTQTGQGDGTLNLNALNTTVTSNYFVGDTATSQFIFGDAGGNILNGRIGTGAGGAADTLIGGNGNDTYRVYDQTDIVIEDSNGGAQDFIYTDVSYSLAANDANANGVTFSTTAAAGGVAANDRAINTFINAPMQIEVLSAADQSATTNINLTGNAYGQIIVGTFGNNVISDGGSQITINGVTTQYQDQLAGLRGNDTYNVTAQNTTVNENVGEGTDVVNVNLDASGQSYFGLIAAAEVEFVNATGNNAISLQGNQYNQVLTGNAAANTLNGGGGQDTLVGGDGSDSYVVDASNAANVVIIEGAGAGGDVDRIVTSVSFDLAATNVSYVNSAGVTVAAGGNIGIEQIVVANGQGTEAINLTGNGAAQILVGNYGNNILDGDNDTRAGGAGTPLTGTAAGDTLTGLFGDDTYRVYSQNDVIREVAGQGTDTVFTSGNYQLRAGNSIEALSAADQSSTTGLQLIGNEFAQSIIGTNGSDTIWGGNGNDTLTGRGGSDIFGFNEVGAGAADIIADFTPGDFIGLSNSAFAGVAANGTFDQNEFVLGTTAVGTNAQVIYDQSTGQLFYDADGTGTASTAVLFATVTPGTALGFNDFQIIAPPPATPAAA